MPRRVFVLLAVFLSLPSFPVFAVTADTDDLAVQVALDRAGFSPGVIDGSMGELTRKALRGFQEAKGLDVTGEMNAQTQAALGDLSASVATVAVTKDDAAGPFTPNIPASLDQQAKLDSLGYSSIVEALAEKYHTTPAELRALNKDADFAAGSQITVPAVRPASMGDDKDNWDATLDKLSVAKDQPLAAKVVVSKADRQLQAFDEAGKLLVQFPATIGSEHDPLPLGMWKVQGVSKLPHFNYNPDLFWDAKKHDKEATLPPGPNGPVGVVWIDLSKDHYGIHGTPSPEKIGRTESHGCVRLTNWDAAKLAQMVRPGTPVLFQD